MDLFGDSNDSLNFDDLFEKGPNPLDDLKLENPDQAVAFLACSPDNDYQNLVPTLSLTLAVPVVGVTSVGMPFENATEPFGMHLSFLGKKNTFRSVAVSDPIDPERTDEVMTNLYTKCVEGLEGEPKLFVVFMPVLANLYVDDHMSRLFELCGQVPVIGGMASDDFRSTRTAAFGGDKAYGDRFVLLGLSGDIRPAFGSACEITTPSGYMPVVTDAEDNVIRRVDDMPFAEYMQKLGFGPDATLDFPLSIRIRVPGAPAEEDFPRIGSIVSFDAETGSGTLSTKVAVGSTISVGYINKDNIANSTRLAVSRLKENMDAIAADGYAFDTLFAVSCVARYYTMLAQLNVEASILVEELTGTMAGFGFYAFTEIGPVPDAGGVLRNRHHRQSLILCAI